MQINDRIAEQAEKSFVVTRIFDAPRELVFRAWIDPQFMAQWWGPKGFTNEVCTLDVRPGGAIRIDMTGPDGVVAPMRGVFHEIVEPERLVMTTSAVPDDRGNDQLEVLNTITFVEKNGKTELTVHAVVVKQSPAVARAPEGTQIGWSQSLDKLADRLATSFHNGY